MATFLALCFSLMWGSFLNVVAYRLMVGQSIITPRSHCISCKQTIAWYDNIPVISWIILRGKCRSCTASISWLYPCIELSALTIFALSQYISHLYFLGYFILFSALIVTIRTDLEYMLIIPEICLYPIPLAWILSYNGLLQIDLSQSIIGTIIGYGLLWSIARLYYLVTKKQGLGEGDFDLMALIGAFTGVEGVFSALFLASWTGTIVGTIYLLLYKQSKECRIPFAPFLSFGAIIYVFLQKSIHAWFTTGQLLF